MPPLPPPLNNRIINKWSRNSICVVDMKISHQLINKWSRNSICVVSSAVGISTHETWNSVTCQGNPCVWMLHPWPRYSIRVQTAQAFLLTEFRQFRPCLHAQIQAYMRPWRIFTVNTELSIVSSRSAAGQDLYRVIQEVCSYRVSQREHY